MYLRTSLFPYLFIYLFIFLFVCLFVYLLLYILIIIYIILRLNLRRINTVYFLCYLLSLFGIPEAYLVVFCFCLAWIFVRLFVSLFYMWSVIYYY